MLSLYVIQINWFWVTIQLTQLYCAVVVAVSIANYDGFWCYRMVQSVSTTELQQRFLEYLGGGLLILDPLFRSYFQGKQQANLHGTG